MKEFEHIIKRELKIPFCNLDGISKDVVAEIIIGLKQLYNLYPFFKNVICAIESIEDFKDHDNILEFSDLYDFEHNNCVYDRNARLCNDEFEYMINMRRNKEDTFCSIVIGNFSSNLIKYSDIDYPCSSCGRFGIYHEFGHLLDEFLNISCSVEFSDIIKNYDIKNEISEYACTSKDELLADAFAFYLLNKLIDDNPIINDISHPINIDNLKSNEFIEKIGKLVDRKYQNFVRFRQLNFLSKKYNFKSKYDIQRIYEINKENYNFEVITQEQRGMYTLAYYIYRLKEIQQYVPEDLSDTIRRMEEDLKILKEKEEISKTKKLTK